MFRTDYDLSIEQIREMVDYNPDTGEFTWKPRVPVTRGNKVFNSRFAGKDCGGGSIKQGQGYTRIKIKGTTIKAHRLAFAVMEGFWPEQYVDHINGDKQDNRWCNLRLATKIENGRNQKLYHNNRSGKQGVWFSKSKGKWEVQIGSAQSREYLGAYDNYEDAVRARECRERDLGYHDNHGRT